MRNISFVDIQLEDVGTPIAINQVYCPHSQHPGECQRGTSAVHISDITVRRMVRIKVLVKHGTHQPSLRVENLAFDTFLELSTAFLFTC